jgi:iron-sulfur cluster assembly protein
MALKLTENAAKELRRMIAEKKKPETTVVRLGVAGGGCSGFEYKMEFTETVDQQDVVSESHGLKLAVDPRSLRFVDGTEIDFHDDLLKRAFVFHNPLAVKTCGCGTSFKA